MFRPFMLKANWLKTIAFNFRMLPFEQAIHLPLLLFGKIDISGCEGRIKLAPPLVAAQIRLGRLLLVINFPYGDIIIRRE